MKQAAELYHRACEGGDAQACNNLGASYADGAGVVKDLSRAIDLYRRACDAQNEYGCRNLATKYEYGSGVAKDLSRALTLYRTACDLKHEGACDAVKRLAAVVPSTPSAASNTLPPALAEMLTKCTSGVAAATRAKPWRYRLKKSFRATSCVILA